MRLPLGPTWILLSIACDSSHSPKIDSPSPDSAAPDSAAPESDEPAGAPEIEGLWTLEDPIPCDSPAPAISYGDATSLLANPGRSEMPEDQSGVALLVVDGELEVVEPEPTSGAWVWRLGAEVAHWTSNQFVQRVYAEDVNRDGVTDLFSLDHRLQLTLSFGAEGQTSMELAAWESHQLVRKVLVMDVDLDGMQDLVALVADGEERELSGIWLLRATGEDSWGEAEPLVGGDFLGVVFEAQVYDIDDDGDEDIYVCNDFGGTYLPNLWLLSDGAGDFEVGAGTGAEVPTLCMGASLGDPNRDGRMDLYVAASGAQSLLLQTEMGYVDSALALGLDPLASGQMVWGSAWMDHNNDGLLDLLLGTSDFSMPSPADPWPIWLYEQQTDGSFEQVADRYGLPTETGARSVIPWDINEDGVLDLLISDFGRNPWLFLSEGCTEQGWLEVEAPPGALIQIDAGGSTQTALVNTMPGFSASLPPVVHFGLGEAQDVDEIRVRLPGGDRAHLDGPVQGRRRIRFSP